MSVASEADLTDEFDVDDVIGDEVAPSWNVAPTDPVRVIVQRVPYESDAPAARQTTSGTGAVRQSGTARQSGAVRQLRTVRWGLVPNWSRDAKGGARMINARIETVSSKPAFKAAAARRRCLVPALGYYEWQATDQGKVPHFLHDPDGRLLAMAGLYELWRDPARADDDPQRWLWTCTIITQQATDLLGEIHDRNPMVVPVELREQWLDCSADDAAVARHILDEIPPAQLAPYVVGPAVGNVRNNGPELIDPVAGGPSQQQLPL